MPTQTAQAPSSDLETLQNLKDMIKAGQHEFYRAVPQPQVLSALYIGPNGQPQPAPSETPVAAAATHASWDRPGTTASTVYSSNGQQNHTRTRHDPIGVDRRPPDVRPQAAPATASSSLAARNAVERPVVASRNPQNNPVAPPSTAPVATSASASHGQAQGQGQASVGQTQTTSLRDRIAPPGAAAPNETQALAQPQGSASSVLPPAPPASSALVAPTPTPSAVNPRSLEERLSTALPSATSNGRYDDRLAPAPRSASRDRYEPRERERELTRLTPPRERPLEHYSERDRYYASGDRYAPLPPPPSSTERDRYLPSVDRYLPVSASEREREREREQRERERAHASYPPLPPPPPRSASVVPERRYYDEPERRAEYHRPEYDDRDRRYPAPALPLPPPPLPVERVERERRDWPADYTGERRTWEVRQAPSPAPHPLHPPSHPLASHPVGVSAVAASAPYAAFAPLQNPPPRTFRVPSPPRDSRIRPRSLSPGRGIVPPPTKRARGEEYVASGAVVAPPQGDYYRPAPDPRDHPAATLTPRDAPPPTRELRDMPPLGREPHRELLRDVREPARELRDMPPLGRELRDPRDLREPPRELRDAPPLRDIRDLPREHREVRDLPREHREPRELAPQALVPSPTAIRDPRDRDPRTALPASASLPPATREARPPPVLPSRDPRDRDAVSVTPRSSDPRVTPTSRDRDRDPRDDPSPRRAPPPPPPVPASLPPNGSGYYERDGRPDPRLDPRDVRPSERERERELREREQRERERDRERDARERERERDTRERERDMRDIRDVHTHAHSSHSLPPPPSLHQQHPHRDAHPLPAPPPRQLREAPPLRDGRDPRDAVPMRGDPRDVRIDPRERDREILRERERDRERPLDYPGPGPAVASSSSSAAAAAAVYRDRDDRDRRYIPQPPR
ncbi:hypothetical protein C8F01DRAFT_1378099 [Mycena amicta]|nr:hypothetical protein C8F01DRAFT_1378099 [Mycena amicta]